MRRIEWADKSGLIALEMVGYPPNIIRQNKNKMELEFNNKSESITAKDIADVERKNKFIFPQEIKSFLLANNGGQPNKTIYTQNSQDYVVDFFLPIKSTEFEDLTYSATITDLSDIIPNTVIPFAIDPFGNYFVLTKLKVKSISWKWKK